MSEKKYYTSEELDLKIRDSLLKNAKDLAKEIKNEQFNSKQVEYV